MWWMWPTAERGGNRDRREGQGPQKGVLFLQRPERGAERRRDERQTLDQRHTVKDDHPEFDRLKGYLRSK